MVEGAACRFPTPLRQAFGLPPPHEWGGLVNGAADFVAAQCRDDALDLPPVAEAGDIPVVTAALGARRSLEARIIAIARHELGRVGQRRAAVNEGAVHARSITRPQFPD